jgi:type IV pilus assembly protein PilA
MRSARLAKGFTLIELMIVVAIIAILAAIAIPMFQEYAIRAQVSEGAVLASGAKNAVGDFISSNGHYPATNESAGLAPSTSITGNYVSSVDISTGAIVVAFKGPKASPQIADQTLVFTPVTYANAIGWSCTKGTLEPRYLPPTCRQ